MPAELPVDVHNPLVDSYNDWKEKGTDRSRDIFLSRLLAITDAGWSLSATARSLGLSRERVRQFSVQSLSRRDALPAYKAKIPTPPPRPARRVAPGRARVSDEVINGYAKRLLKLQPLASQARGHHGPESKERQASDQYSKVLAEAVEANVPITVLAEKVGRHPAGLRTRIRTADRIGSLGTSGLRHREGVRDPVIVERWAKKLRPLLDDISAGGPNVDRVKSDKARKLLRKAVEPPNNISLRALAKACDRSYHSLWVRYGSNAKKEKEVVY